MSAASDTAEDATGDRDGPLSGVVDLLVRRRHLLLTLYLLLIAGSAVLLGVFGVDSLITACHGLFRFLRGDEAPFEIVKREGGMDAATLAVTAGVFFGLQAAFLWGGGRIGVGRKGTPWYKVALSVAVIAALAALLTLAALLLFMQFLLTDSVDKTLDKAPEFVLPVVLGTSWIAWLAVAALQFRGRDQRSALSRLAGGLLAGSWVEFALALPVDIAVRARHENCPCFTGSWLALLIVIPVMIWSLGPALYLMYLRERAKAGADPGRPRRILRAKSAFRRPVRQAAP
ncbi:MAG: hypothetical protein GEU92_15870 [Alphaproteobacteria bacterium]|nr:hypothetical protein [Alphaproteobacteria bacterium]